MRGFWGLLRGFAGFEGLGGFEGFEGFEGLGLRVLEFGVGV